MVWTVLGVVSSLLLTAWLVDRRGGSGTTADRAFRRSTEDFARGEHYRFLRRG